MDLTSQQHCLSDGRNIGFAEFGDPAGHPLIFCHGFPSSRLEGALYHTAALRRKLRFVVLERPGYGLSDSLPPGKVSDWSDDVAALADHLGFERFALLGVSGGGPYALACAAALADRIVAAGIVCGLGLVYENWARRGMNWPARLGFGLARQSRLGLRFVYGEATAKLMRWKPQVCLSLLTLSGPQSDQRVLRRNDVSDYLLASFQESFRQGANGAINDFIHYAHDWGYDPKSINLSVNFWHGTDDKLVPPEHTKHFASQLRNKQLRLIPGEGHFSLPINYGDEILSELIHHSKLRSVKTG